MAWWHGVAAVVAGGVVGGVIGKVAARKEADPITKAVAPLAGATVGIAAVGVGGLVIAAVSEKHRSAGIGAAATLGALVVAGEVKEHLLGS